ncbi:ATP-binding cassette domain-containing protein [Nakamurella antarctica]|uniref:ATP-binding cassette domain-containing protein n=1 Tax=Nakamurella antarctica TaxID=1902245 RepID=A0A3G8ZPA0_9ACTN|nr:ATP-binding cassette domain-containing protein [Nakamurella antarctica]AZI58968.1 ATP-binding cassette domain-containing protein [Nakamurella antarctica]
MMIHRRLLELAGRVWWPMTVCVLMGLIVSGTYIAQALLVAQALTELFEGSADGAIRYLSFALIFIVLRTGVIWVREVVTTWAGGLIRARLRDRLVAALADLGPAYLSHARAGAAQATLTDGVDGLDPYYSRYLPQVVVTVLVPTALVAWMFTLNTTIAWVLLICIVLVLTVPRLQDLKLMATGKQRWQAYTDLSADYLEAMQGITTLRSFGAAERRRDTLEERSHTLYQDTMAELKLSLTESGMTALLVQTGTSAAVVLAAVAVGRGEGGASLMFLVLLIAFECFRPVRDLGKAWHAGYLGITAVDGITALLSAKPTVADSGTSLAPWKAGTPPTITFEDVQFSYPGARTPALQRLDLTIRAGRTTAIVGRSGAGKSTLVSLLGRTHDPDVGSILFDGMDIRELRIEELRASLAVVNQHTYLFNISVRENLRLGAVDASEQQVEHACRMAQADEFIRELPQGYETVLDEGGKSLSGGQRQRLALARAILRNAPVLILDEATSHVDTAGEFEIVQALKGVREGRTCLMIAHRLSTIAEADDIVVLDDGCIVQQGAAVDLRGRPGPLVDLLNSQEVRV